MVDLAVARTRLDALAESLRLTRRQRTYADALLADPHATVPTLVRKHPKVRRYIDEAIVQQRENAKELGQEPIPTQSEVIARMAMRSRARLWEFVSFPEFEDTEDPETKEKVAGYKLKSGDITLPGGAVLNIKAALAAGLGPCIKSMELDKDGVAKIEFADSMDADKTLGKWLNLENAPPPPEDSSIRHQREAMRMLLATDPEAARQLESTSIKIDMLSITIRKDA